MSDPVSTFLAKFIPGLLHASHRYVRGNRDPAFEAEQGGSVRRQVREALCAGLSQRGFTRRNYKPATAEAELLHIIEHLQEYAQVCELLADTTSKKLFEELLTYRVLGPEHVKLSTATPEYWTKRRAADAAKRHGGEHQVGQWTLHKCEVPGQAGPIRLFLHPFGLATTFGMEHYALRREEVTIAASHGDVVLDAGGCWGDTALYFADKVGEAGRVACFEFDEGNLPLLRGNLALNPALAARIDIVEHPVWSSSGDSIQYTASGPSTHVRSATGPLRATTVTIDDWVASQGIAKVDFIKMDIEGAELEALRGAAGTLRRCRPRLAISLYHAREDFFRIPLYLAGLDLGYRFHLHHVTVHLMETVLFATPAP